MNVFRDIETCMFFWDLPTDYINPSSNAHTPMLLVLDKLQFVQSATPASEFNVNLPSANRCPN